MNTNCSLTFSEIGRLFSYNEFLLPILFFIIQGILMPNFDDIHYVFLTEEVNMEKYKYDFLNCAGYISMTLFIFLYGAYFSRT